MTSDLTSQAFIAQKVQEDISVKTQLVSLGQQHALKDNFTRPIVSQFSHLSSSYFLSNFPLINFNIST